MEENQSDLNRGRWLPLALLAVALVVVVLEIMRRWQQTPRPDMPTATPPPDVEVDEGREYLQDEVDEASWESLPASDPPAWTRRPRGEDEQ